MKSRYKLVLVVAPLILILDQLSKWWVMMTVPRGGARIIIPGFFELIHTRNEGAAFGLLANADAAFRVPFFYIVAAVAAVVLILVLWKTDEGDRATPYACAFILGGIAGNIVDRLRFGGVVDFLSFHWQDTVFSQTILGRHITFPLSWPAFNIADAAITIAVFLLLIGSFGKKTVVSRDT